MSEAPCVTSQSRRTRSPATYPAAQQAQDRLARDAQLVCGLRDGVSRTFLSFLFTKFHLHRLKDMALRDPPLCCRLISPSVTPLFLLAFQRLLPVRNTSATTLGSNNNNGSASAYANSSAMKKPVLKHRSISEMLTGALQPSARSGSPGAVANGLVVVREGPLVEEVEDENDYQEQERERERDEDEDASRDGPTPVQRPKMMHTRSDTNVLLRLANKETRLSPPRVAVAAQQRQHQHQQGEGQGPQGQSPQPPYPSPTPTSPPTQFHARPPRPPSPPPLPPRAHTCVPRWARLRARLTALPHHIRLPQRRVGQPCRPCRAQRFVEVTLGQ